MTRNKNGIRYRMGREQITKHFDLMRMHTATPPGVLRREVLRKLDRIEALSLYLYARIFPKE
jgi:hypothetical protein